MTDEIVLPLHSPSSLPSDTQTYPPMASEKASEALTAYSIASLTVHIPSARRPTSSLRKNPSRWGTLEFRFYYLAALFAIPTMAWVPISLSQGGLVIFLCSLMWNWFQISFTPKLSFLRFEAISGLDKQSAGGEYFPGFLFSMANFRQDNSDAQYRSFRDNLPILFNTAAVYIAIKFLIKYLNNNKLFLIPANVVLSTIMVIALHGSSSLKIFIIMAINFIIAKKCRASLLGPLLTWLFNALALFSNELYHGYQFGQVLPGLSALVGFKTLSKFILTPSRTHSRGYIQDGMSSSILQCFGSYRLTWIITGLAKTQTLLMWVRLFVISESCSKAQFFPRLPQTPQKNSVSWPLIAKNTTRLWTTWLTFYIPLFISQVPLSPSTTSCGRSVPHLSYTFPGLTDS